VLTAPLNVNAWDEVTHAYMTNMIPDLVKDSELKVLLQKNSTEFIYGCWYTDTYQYTKSKNKRVGELNPHVIRLHDKAFMNYLNKDNVKQQENYNKLVALFLGSLAHFAEDMWYDNNLSPYQKTKADKFKGDSKHGAFVAKQHGYIGLRVKRYFPVDDLFKLYSEAGLLKEGYNAKEEFEEMIDSWSNVQYKKLRALKLLNFVAGNQLYSASPWTAANLKDAPAGMLNSANVAALLVESAWGRLHGQEVNDIIHVQYMWPVRSLAFFFSGEEESEILKNNNCFIIDEEADTIRGKISSFKDRPMVKRFVPEKPFVDGGNYKFVLLSESGETIYNFSFNADYDYKMEENMAETKPLWTRLGLGLFGFIPLVGIACLFFGLSGIILFRWNVINANKQMPIYLITVRRLLGTVGLFVLGYSLYMLFTSGWVIVNMAL
jgi:hypothetical protein